MSPSDQTRTSTCFRLSAPSEPTTTAEEMYNVTPMPDLDVDDLGQYIQDRRVVGVRPESHTLLITNTP